ncbi:DUF5110 domain-containing protein [bacterium]|nr:DUF5110 domain-containing protein [bacterium]
MTTPEPPAIPAPETAKPAPAPQAQTSDWYDMPVRRTLHDDGDLVMYCIYVRNYTPEGTFDAARERLPEVKDLGANIIWLLPIHPIGKEKRKGPDGSPYSISDYYAIDPALGTEEDFKEYIAAAHDLGIKVMMDCVVNHTAHDHVWAKAHPEWYLRDANGNPRAEYDDWTDIVDLDWDCPDVREQCSKVLRYWVTEFGIDGYRCDVADLVPRDWWSEITDELRDLDPDFLMFAESQEASHYSNGFDMVHYEGLRDNLLEVVHGKKSALAVWQDCHRRQLHYPKDSMQVLFLENHDKPRAISAFGGVEPMKAAAVLTMTLPGVPLVYAGIEVGEGSDRDATFFTRTPIDFTQDPHNLRAFWKDLIATRHAHPALQDGELNLLKTEQPDKILAFERTSPTDQALVVVNLSKEPVRMTLTHDLVEGNELELPAWGWKILTEDNLLPSVKNSNGKANPDAVVIAGNARFTVLTPELIRMEWSPNGQFEDRQSFAFINRNLPAPAFRTERKGDGVLIKTNDLELHYTGVGVGFTKENLSIEFHVADEVKHWVPGMENSGNLRGTTRTLDSVNGPTELDPGLLSRDGWVLVDDSKRLLFGDENLPWFHMRANDKALDWYFFGHGHDYKQALADFTKVAGKIPMPPRYLMGAWWSRYWNYSDEELKELVEAYKKRDIPLDILVVDMDWHLVGEQYPDNGWTGYTWNRELFPDPPAFLKWVHDQGLHVTLNLHPHSGVGKHEAAFPEVARAMGLDPNKIDGVPFDCTSPQYMDAYFKYLHHPLEDEGVDFWWLDWQQGSVSGAPGLDPLFWLNYMHWTDMETNPARAGKRPVIFSRWGGLGNHRYQIGFSGDTYSTWETVAFQSKFTATAGNVGYGYWSNDIGGHFPGPVEPEIYARWIQLGALSPFLRTHATKHPDAVRAIWKFPDEVFESARKSFHLRYHLLPYTYTAAREAYDTGVSMCRPMYYNWAKFDEAYEFTEEYMLGDDLLISPVASPRDPVSGCALKETWLPPGEWIDWLTGETHEGPAVITSLATLDEVPIFVRAGSIIPAATKRHRVNEKPLDPAILHIYPGVEGEGRLYEDDGETIAYQKGSCAWTQFTQRTQDGRTVITIEPIKGEFDGLLTTRAWQLRLESTWAPMSVTCDGEAIPQKAANSDSAGWYHDPRAMVTVVDIESAPTNKPRTIIIQPSESDLADAMKSRLHCLYAADDLLGDNSPSELRATLELAESLSEQADSPNALVDAMDGEHWLTLLKSIGDSEADPDDVLQATARLLGLTAALRATGSADPTHPIRVEADVNLLRDAGDLSGAISLKTPQNWRVEGATEVPIGQLKPGAPVTASFDLAPIGNPQTTYLEAEILLRHGGREFRVPFRDLLLPSISEWYVIGPFDNAWEDGLDKVFPPEESIDLAATYPGKNGRTASWRPIKRTIDAETNLSDEFVVDLHEATGGFNEYAAAYAVTWLEAPEEMDVILAIGSDDGVAAWLNGEEVHRNSVGRPYKSKQDIVPVHLKKGTNELLLKITQGAAGWEFGVHVDAPDGTPALAVKASIPSK